MSKLTFSEDAWEEYLYWQTQDKRTLRKINTLLREIQRTPYDGSGKPEPLRGELSGFWSRRINETDRLVYSVESDMIIVVQCHGHYTDH